MATLSSAMITDPSCDAILAGGGTPDDVDSRHKTLDRGQQLQGAVCVRGEDHCEYGTRRVVARQRDAHRFVRCLRRISRWGMPNPEPASSRSGGAGLIDSGLRLLT